MRNLVGLYVLSLLAPFEVLAQTVQDCICWVPLHFCIMADEAVAAAVVVDNAIGMCKASGAVSSSMYWVMYIFLLSGLLWQDLWHKVAGFCQPRQKRSVKTQIATVYQLDCMTLKFGPIPAQITQVELCESE